MATIPGSPGPDALDGTEFDDTITALDGDDTVTALAGDDLVDLGNGDDRADGGQGNDQIYAGGGTNAVAAKTGNDLVDYITREANTLSGGAGDDTLSANADQSSLYFIVDIGDGSVDDGSLSVISGFEHFVAYGGSFADIAGLGRASDAFYGGDGRDTAFGGNGDDILTGGGSDDSLEGGGGGDVLHGGAGSDTILGGNGNDRIGGGWGSDSIHAGAGDDRIRFYTGNDTVSGGSGADTFLFTRNQSGGHTITDFVSGEDALHYTGLYFPNSPPPGQLDRALLFFGAAGGPQAQFILTYSATTDTTSLLWDQNGDNSSGGTYLMAIFSGNVAVVAEDIFIL